MADFVPSLWQREVYEAMKESLFDRLISEKDVDDVRRKQHESRILAAAKAAEKNAKDADQALLSGLPGLDRQSLVSGGARLGKTLNIPMFSGEIKASSNLVMPTAPPKHLVIPLPQIQGVVFTMPDRDMIDLEHEKFVTEMKEQVRMHTNQLFIRTMAELNAPMHAKVADLERQLSEMVVLNKQLADTVHNMSNVLDEVTQRIHGVQPQAPQVFASPSPPKSVIKQIEKYLEDKDAESLAEANEIEESKL